MRVLKICPKDIQTKQILFTRLGLNLDLNLCCILEGFACKMYLLYLFMQILMSINFVFSLDFFPAFVFFKYVFVVTSKLRESMEFEFIITNFMVSIGQKKSAGGLGTKAPLVGFRFNLCLSYILAFNLIDWK